MKLFDSELKVMEVLWEHEENAAETSEKVSAKQIVDVLSQRIGWNKNTTYTVIKKCIEKGAVERGDPGFFCIPLVSRDEVARSETEQLIDKMFGGSSELFFSSFLKNQGISDEDAARLAKMIRDSD
ncbi:MAG: BlaI/MecI/CopY family transcriptional regulator [Lachnospiraceae bacterium]|jgi:BlaI family penicillinase repressor|nr:BlaI/MecI/CopY family transcriptional regulator [Lachnospiraceae bacterium]MDE6990602.1 BlaI/MecI/CopY family transcriptional regulator [Lachnospiraceae bacterium]